MAIRQNRLVWQPVVLGQQNARTNQVIVTDGLAEGESILATRVSLKREGAPVRYPESPATAREG